MGKELRLTSLLFFLVSPPAMALAVMYRSIMPMRFDEFVDSVINDAAVAPTDYVSKLTIEVMAEIYRLRVTWPFRAILAHAKRSQMTVIKQYFNCLYLNNASTASGLQPVGEVMLAWR